jgi:glycerophosphoryl diester phosphodiesterase
MTAHKWIVAHRGDHSHEKPNTIAAFREAIRAGADMIEFDVRRLADGRLVVWHDDTIDGTPVDRLSPESFYRSASAAGISVPILSEVLQVCAGRILLDIELKDYGCEEDVLRALFAGRLNPEDCVLTSFDADQLERIRQAHSSMRTGLLTETRELQAVVQLRERAAANYLAPECAGLSDAALGEFFKLNIPLLPWTVNSSQDLSRLLAAPAVAGVITDCVPLALGLRDAMADRCRGRA